MCAHGYFSAVLVRKTFATCKELQGKPVASLQRGEEDEDGGAGDAGSGEALGGGGAGDAPPGTGERGRRRVAHRYTLRDRTRHQVDFFKPGVDDERTRCCNSAAWLWQAWTVISQARREAFCVVFLYASTSQLLVLMQQMPLPFRKMALYGPCCTWACHQASTCCSTAARLVRCHALGCLQWSVSSCFA